jgi:hypothetical protein
METAAADGTIVAVQDVLLELERQDDDVFAWAKRHVTFMLLEDEIQASATEILARFPQLVNTRRSRSVADPFSRWLAGWIRGSSPNAKWRIRPKRCAAAPQRPTRCGRGIRAAGSRVSGGCGDLAAPRSDR